MIAVISYRKMSIDKFGLSKLRNDTDDSYHHWSGIVRNYVRENALCCVVTDFDARLRKIRRLAQPEINTDAVNKLYVDQYIKTLMNHQKESDERLTSLEKDVRALQIAINELQHTIIKAESETTTNSNERQ